MLIIRDLHQAGDASIAIWSDASLRLNLPFTKGSPTILVHIPTVRLKKARKNPMNPANLPFDSESMLAGLRGWVECESPTWDAAAVERMLDIAARDMAIMGASIERIAGRQGLPVAFAPAFRTRNRASRAS